MPLLPSSQSRIKTNMKLSHSLPTSRRIFKNIILFYTLLLTTMSRTSVFFCHSFVVTNPSSFATTTVIDKFQKKIKNGKLKRNRCVAVREIEKDIEEDGGSNVYYEEGGRKKLHQSPPLPTLKSLFAENDSDCHERDYNKKGKEEENSVAATRRMFMASALISTGLTVGSGNSGSIANAASITYKTSPINKRSGITLFDAEKNGYNIRFITYLSRFLLYFDKDCQTWWYTSAKSIPRRASSKEVEEYRYMQFASFAASVEVGLQDYAGGGNNSPDGPLKLMKSLLSRYAAAEGENNNSEDGKDTRQSTSSSSSDGTTQTSQPKLPNKAQQQQSQQIKKEAKRQIALLFGLMEKYQPVEELTKLLASIDNATITTVYVEYPGTGYAPGYGAPLVTFPKPDAASDNEGDDDDNNDNYEQATGRAILSWSGRILRIDLSERGSGYAGSKPPSVTVSPPKILSESNSTAIASTAKAKAYLFPTTSLKNRGRIERIEILHPGLGYTPDETITVTIESTPTPADKGGVNATAVAIPELQVSGIEIINGGSGYVAEKPIRIQVEPPPITSRVNMNDPLIMSSSGGMGLVDPNKPLPYSKTTGNNNNKRKNKNKDDDEEFLDNVRTQAVDQEAKAGGRGGGGGCVGRACYDREVVAYGYPTAKEEKDSYTSFYSKKPDDMMMGGIGGEKEMVRATSSGGGDDNLPSPPFWGGGSKSSSSQLLYLLPSGVGLQYDANLGRYILTVANDDDDENDSSKNKPRLLKGKPIDPDFGPRGRSPIEREKELDIPTALRFCLSGALCSSGAHLLLTPIDVVKTKVQTNPSKFTGSIWDAFGIVAEEDGLKAFVTGWQPTFLGFFVWGGTSYTLTEFFRRLLTSSLSAGSGGVVSPSLEVPIILGSAAIAAVFGAFVISPFEAVRIRFVAQPDFADNIFGVLKRMVSEEGLVSLFSIVPVYIAKEVPFAAAKFTVFDLSTEYMYESFPAAREDLQLSLLVSVAGGILGGIAAAIVSNPADATISEMKKAKTDMGPLEAVGTLLDRAGIPALFKGLGLRIFFYSLLVSLQFLVYDSVRFALGIGSDDLKLYLDVLGSALQDSNGGGG